MVTYIIVAIIALLINFWILQIVFHVQYRSKKAGQTVDMLALIAKKLGATDDEINKITQKD